MVKKIYLAGILYLLGCGSLFAQDTTIVPPDDDPTDTVINEAEFRAMVESDLYNHIDNCNIPLLTGIAVVKFESYANVYIPHNPNSLHFTDHPFDVYSEDGEAVGDSYAFSDASIVITNLDLDKHYTIMATDICGNVVQVAQFNTFINTDDSEKDQVVISGELMEVLSEVSDENNSLDFVYGLLLEAPSVPYFEKMAFIQDYFMSGQPYDNTLDVLVTGIEISGIEFTTAVDHFISIDLLDWILRSRNRDCNCRVLMTLEVGKIQDGYVNLSQGNVYPSYPTSNNNVISEMDEKYYKLWHSHSRMGASRYEQVWQRGKNSVPRERVLNDYSPSGSVKPPYLSQIEYNLLCTRLGTYYSDCKCTKNMDVEYEYLTTVNTEISDVKGSSSVQASARDFAMLVIDNGIAAPVVEANMIAIGQSYSQTVSYTNVMKGIGEIIKGAIRMSRWGKKQTEAGLGMIIDGIVTTVDGAKNVKTFEGHLGARSNTGLLLDGITTVELKSNNVTSITMYSASALQTSGKKYWSSTARTVSGYHLSTLVPCGTGEDGGTCYTTGAAAWMAGSVESPALHQAFKDDVNSFYYLRGYDNFTNKEVGRLERICLPFRLPVISAGAMVDLDTDFTGPFQYSIINVIGQEVQKGTYDYKTFDQAVFNTQLDLLRPDVYILRLRDAQGQIQHIKFYHQK